jgi:hypothetical protein
VEVSGGGVDGGIWRREIAEALVEELGGRIWWREVVEALVEEFGGGI